DDVNVGLAGHDQRLKGRVVRFLVGMWRADWSRRASREGYTASEHALGWRLMRAADGEGMPIDHLFAEVRRGEDSARSRSVRTFRELDAFENTWFPRVRAIIRRVVPPDARDEFERGFFKDLVQQPFGPGVVRSVGTLCSRVEALATSAQPHAGAV